MVKEKKDLGFSKFRVKFVTKKENVKITTIDNYCLDKKIDKIDLLKIDTQGYEDKVLEGILRLALKKKKLEVSLQK